MARHKDFDLQVATKAAMKVFALYGYEGTSTNDLLDAMGIGRQSLYDTFGGKRKLYLAAFRHYNATSVEDLVQTLNKTTSPLSDIEETLLSLAAQDSASGCMLVSAICEFGPFDKEIALITNAARREYVSALARRLVDAKTLSEISGTIDVTNAAEFISAAIFGIRVSARAGVPLERLREIVGMTLRCLK